MKSLFAVIAVALAIIILNSSLAKEWRGSNGPTNSKVELHKLAAKHLPNAIQVHEKVISGGQPDGEPGFRELMELGVKTIISVDGAAPKVAMAKQYGLRYVHLPHGYNGILRERAQELAKAVRDLEGPIYIHCHHGKHRSPAAAAVACVSAGMIEPSASMAILKLAGTDEDYRGLFESVSSAHRFPDTILDALHPEFPESSKLPPMAEAMVELDHTHDHLKQLKASEWKSPPDHPDMDPAHEALILRQHFTEMLRMEIVSKQPNGFQKLLKESESDSRELLAAIRQWDRSAKHSTIPSSIVEPFRRISENCTSCHREYRHLHLEQ